MLREEKSDLTTEEYARREATMRRLIGYDSTASRLINALTREGITLPEHFNEVTDEQIAGIKWVGESCMDRVAEVRDRLKNGDWS